MTGATTRFKLLAGVCVHAVYISIEPYINCSALVRRRTITFTATAGGVYYNYHFRKSYPVL